MDIARQHRSTWHSLCNDQETQSIIINWSHLISIGTLYHFHLCFRVLKGRVSTVRCAKSFPCAPITLDRGRRGVQTLSCNQGCMLTARLLALACMHACTTLKWFVAGCGGAQDTTYNFMCWLTPKSHALAHWCIARGVCRLQRFQVWLNSKEPHAQHTGLLQAGGGY